MLVALVSRNIYIKNKKKNTLTAQWRGRVLGWCCRSLPLIPSSPSLSSCGVVVLSLLFRRGSLLRGPVVVVPPLFPPPRPLAPPCRPAASSSGRRPGPGRRGPVIVVLPLFPSPRPLIPLLVVPRCRRPAIVVHCRCRGPTPLVHNRAPAIHPASRGSQRCVAGAGPVLSSCCCGCCCRQ